MLTWDRGVAIVNFRNTTESLGDHICSTDSVTLAYLGPDYCGDVSCNSFQQFIALYCDSEEAVDSD